MITVGADPELFVQTQDKFISAHNLIPGTKQNPAEVPFGAIQVDGTAAEFNIKPACSSTEFVHNIGAVIETMSRLIKAKDATAKLAAVPVAIYDKEYFDSLPDHAKEMGCDPDYDAWTEEENQRPETEPFRSGGGHIHVGWGAPDEHRTWSFAHIQNCQDAVKQLDATLYPASLIWDTDSKRRELYGGPGAYRPKSYGVEYRSLSNAWVQDPEIMEWIFNTTVKAMELLNDGECIWEGIHFSNIWDNMDCIDREDITEYYEYLETLGLPPLPECLKGE